MESERQAWANRYKKLLRNLIQSPKLTKGMENALLARAGFEVAVTGRDYPVILKQTVRCFLKLLLMVKLVLLVLAISCLQARAWGQDISLSFKNASLEKVFASIEEQSGYHFIYTKEEIAIAKPVSIDIKNASLAIVLELCFKEQPITYKLQDHYVVVKKKDENKVEGKVKEQKIEGRVVNEEGEAVAGATVTVKGIRIGAATNDKGEFSFSYEGEQTRIIVSNIGYERQEIIFQGKDYLYITLRRTINSLDETIVIAYGNTTRRLNTGNISKVTAEQISKQPVSNPLAALQGRVAGLLITQSSGLNGAGFKVELRGQNSLLQGSEPFYIIDGVPFAPGNNAINQITNATNVAGLSPFNLINPSDIQSIEVLKDADATAIYGSRGANGVIIITTKQGTAGKTSITASAYSGMSNVTRSVDMLNTRQYVEMRKEAFANDGVAMTIANAPDILVWDTTRYTDLKKLLIGGTAHTYDAQVSASGGSNSTRFLLGAGFHKETNVFPNPLADQRASAHTRVNHASDNKKFFINFSSSFSSDKNELNRADLTQYIALPPNIQLYDSSDKINWQEGGVLYRSIISTNPLAMSKTKYTGEFQQLHANLNTGYYVLRDLVVRINAGYNRVYGNEKQISPSESIDPNTTLLPFSSFATMNQKSWILEPQAEYNLHQKKEKLTVLFGATWQENVSDGISISATNYSSDLFLNSVSGAGNVVTTNSYSQYRYEAIFGRITYNHFDKYIINLSARRDGSSRFGPGKQFSNFGAAGVAWIFTKEKIIADAFPFLSFGKLRGSYGITGNDQIGDYKFLDTWTATSNTYQGVSILNPTALFNPDYAWERNRKAEIAIELGLIKDRIFLSVSYYDNQSKNQLINYTLPAQTGFNSIGKNLDAVIQNKGLEFQLTSKNIVNRNFTWSSSVTASINRNKLVDFPELATSSYANTFITGSPIEARRVYRYLGVNPTTGVYEFEDADRNGSMNNIDKIAIANTEVNFYGGILNTIAYKQIRLDLFLEVKNQPGKNYLSSLASSPPGYGIRNHPVLVFERWQMPGDITGVQKFTANSGTPAYVSNSLLLNSNAVISDASYIRCKNISLSYNFPERVLSKAHIKSGSIFINAQNLFTITHYKGADPENQNLYVLPPLKTIAAGLQITF